MEVSFEIIKNIIKNKKVYLWGASNFLKDILKEEKEINPNILGIIDKNENLWGKDFCNYKIYSPAILDNHPADVLVTIYNNYYKAYQAVKKELQIKHPNITVLEDLLKIFINKDDSEKKYCPFCNDKFWFNSAGIVERKNVQCPICFSLERHRFLYYIYKLFIPNNKQIKLLHMAPEKSISSVFLNMKNIDYYCIDLCPEKYKHVPNCLKMNVLDLKFDDNSFDFVISNHVMEHIEEEEKFIKEITRVLKPNGKAIITAPCYFYLEKTYEDYTIQTPEERLKAFGQEDHVRKYGADIFDRIGKYAKVTPINRNAFDNILDDKINDSTAYTAVMLVEKF